MILSGPWIEDDVGDDHDCGDDDDDDGGTQPEAPCVNILKMMMMLNVVTQPEATQAKRQATPLVEERNKESRAFQAFATADWKYFHFFILYIIFQLYTAYTAGI